VAQAVAQAAAQGAAGVFASPQLHHNRISTKKASQGHTLRFLCWPAFFPLSHRPPEAAHCKNFYKSVAELLSLLGLFTRPNFCLTFSTAINMFCKFLL